MIRFLSFVLAVLLLVSCKESVNEPDPTPEGQVVTVSDIPADTTNNGNWTFYRLSDSSIVLSADSNTTNWDIAFRSTAIYTNSMSSGPGNGGAIVLEGQDFDLLNEAPESGYAQDTSATQLAIPTGSGNGWYNYNFMTNIISPIPGNVLVIRTADGKYAKVQILSYYKGAPTSPGPNDVSRFYTFKFFYQPDGSTNLQ